MPAAALLSAPQRAASSSVLTNKCLNAVKSLNEAFILYLSAWCCRCVLRTEVVRDAALMIIRLIKHSCGAERITSGSSLTTPFNASFPSPWRSRSHSHPAWLMQTDCACEAMHGDAARERLLSRELIRAHWPKSGKEFLRLHLSWCTQPVLLPDPE